jgi:peptide subunit release factor 1 (eRF1)
MLTRHDLADLSRAREEDLVLSVYIARDGSDPGSRTGWKLRLDGALGAIRAGLEKEAPDEVAAFDEASTHVMSGLDAFGRVLPHEGWSAFATPEGVFHAEELPFAPPDLVRWRQGIYTAPYVRMLKSVRPVILVLLDAWHARVFEYLDGRMTQRLALGADRSSVDEADVGTSKRASSTSGRRGRTRTDYTGRMLDEEAKRLRRHITEAVLDLAGDASGIALGGTPKATTALRKDLEEHLTDRIVEVSAISFNSSDAELAAATAIAASELTRARQARLLDACMQVPERGSTGWNRTYRALAAGAVDTLLVARGLIEARPEDAERLVRLALAQGAEVEEVGDELGARLMAEADGVAARFRFRMAA